MKKIFKAVDWSHSTNIYEVNIRQYTLEGTFKAFVKELPRLKEMGVKTLWLMPIYPIGVVKRLGSLGSYYSIKDYKAINPEFGSLDDFKFLVEEAHQADFKLIIDWVANHASWDNVWTREHPEYFERDPKGNFHSPFDWKDVIQIDHKNAGQQMAMMDAMEFWVKNFDIDGFRCDMANLVPLDFWKKARAALDKIRPLFWLGEFDELLHPDYVEAFDASYSWSWMHECETFYQKKSSMGNLEAVLKKYDDMGDGSMRTWFTTNHDENSWNGTEYEKYGELAKALAVFSATWNGIPLIYSGQEAMNMKRLKFFDKDAIEWPEEMALHDFYKTLLNLHSNNPALQAGDPEGITFRIKTNQGGKVMAFLRQNREKEVLVILNLSSTDDLKVDLLSDNIKGEFKDVFAPENSAIDPRVVNMQAWSYLVFEK